jgi:hypothetical protein
MPVRRSIKEVYSRKIKVESLGRKKEKRLNAEDAEEERRGHGEGETNAVD